MATPAPFSRYEFLIAWRYLRAKRAEGGVSVMTWISLIGITLAVAALIITLAVRSGFRDEFVSTILGANAHVTVYSQAYEDQNGRITNVIPDYADWAGRLAAVGEVTRVAPLVKGQVMAVADDGSEIGFSSKYGSGDYGVAVAADPERPPGDPPAVHRSPGWIVMA